MRNILGHQERLYTKQNGLMTKLTVSNDVNLPVEIRKVVRITCQLSYFIISFYFEGVGVSD